MTRPVLNLNAPIGEVRFSKVYLLPPWNSFFQQFVQQAPAVQSISVLSSPFQANQNGTVVIQGGTVVSLVRGSTTIVLGNGQFIIPVSISDIVQWTTATNVYFLGA